MLFLAFGLVIVAVGLNSFAEPIIYSFFPPTATLTMTSTITQTPTITLTPSITLTPTITPTPAVTDTPTASPTPHVPLAIEVNFQSTVTPNPNAVFSPIQFAQALDKNFLPVEPALVFNNPVGHLYAQFSYDKMNAGAQWSALWYRGIELVHFESKPWDGGTGGIGYTDWYPAPSDWLPAEYEVQIFVGLTWKVSGRFTVVGAAPTPLPSATSTKTPQPTATPTPTRTITPTLTPSGTPLPTSTPRSSDTHQPTLTSTTRPVVTITISPTYTHAPSFTPAPPTPSYTHAPTFSPAPPTPSYTHAPTFTPKSSVTP